MEGVETRSLRAASTCRPTVGDVEAARRYPLLTSGTYRAADDGGPARTAAWLRGYLRNSRHPCSHNRSPNHMMGPPPSTFAVGGDEAPGRELGGLGIPRLGRLHTFSCRDRCRAA